MLGPSRGGGGCRHIKRLCPAIRGEVICTLGDHATKQLIISWLHYRSIGYDTEKIFVGGYITGSIWQLSVTCVNIWIYSKTNFYKHSQGHWSCWELPDNQYSYKICTLYRIRYHDRVPGLKNWINGFVCFHSNYMYLFIFMEIQMMFSSVIRGIGVTKPHISYRKNFFFNRNRLRNYL